MTTENSREHLVNLAKLDFGSVAIQPMSQGRGWPYVAYNISEANTASVQSKDLKNWKSVRSSSFIDVDFVKGTDSGNRDQLVSNRKTSLRKVIPLPFLTTQHISTVSVVPVRDFDIVTRTDHLIMLNALDVKNVFPNLDPLLYFCAEEFRNFLKNWLIQPNRLTGTIDTEDREVFLKIAKLLHLDRTPPIGMRETHLFSVSFKVSGADDPTTSGRNRELLSAKFNYSLGEFLEPRKSRVYAKCAEELGHVTSLLRSSELSKMASKFLHEIETPTLSSSGVFSGDVESVSANRSIRSFTPAEMEFLLKALTASKYEKLGKLNTELIDRIGKVTLPERVQILDFERRGADSRFSLVTSEELDQLQTVSVPQTRQATSSGFFSGLKSKFFR